MKTSIYFGLLGIILYSFNCFASQPASSCERFFEAPSLSLEMRNTWLKFSPQEQIVVANTITQFWTHHLLRSRIPLSESFPIFLGLAEHMFRSSLGIWPDSYNPLWLKSFLQDLEAQTNTTPEVKDKLSNLRNLLP